MPGRNSGNGADRATLLTGSQQARSCSEQTQLTPEPFVGAWAGGGGSSTPYLLSTTTGLVQTLPC